MTTPDIQHPIKKRRSSSLTMVILAVNIIPLLIMGFGIFYLDKYKQNLIESAYVHLEEKSQMISVLMAEDTNAIERFRSFWPEGKSLYYINSKGEILESIGSFWENSNSEREASGEVLNFTETFAAIFLYLNPLRTSLAPFPLDGSDNPLIKLPELQSALNGVSVLSAWSFNDTFVLTSTAPVRHSDGTTGAILIIMAGDEITEAIDEVRKDIIQAFIIVIILTFLLSVYLSSFIALPLKRLGRAAEDIRRGKRDLTDLPDMSNRKDEIGELSIILRQMTVALDTRIDAIQNFAADVAHEIKNPITSIRSAIETALTVNEEEKRNGLLRIMEQDVHRLDRLITDISKHSRLDSELARDSYQVIDIKSLLKDIAAFWRKPIDRHNPDESSSSYEVIEVILPEEDCYVLGKGDSLGQVFQNLIANALSFHTKNTPVRIKLLQSDDEIIISVEDEGPGIPEGQLTKIFDRFYSDRPEDHDITQNSGLGLSIAKQIIEAHDGKIIAENIKSKEGGKIKGARFNVTLKAYDV
jgi:two-component system sensor histidine kinase ChvG